MWLLALLVCGGCAGEQDRVAPWREPGLMHEKSSQQQVTDNDKDLLKNSQPLPAGTATYQAPAAQAPAAQAPASQPLPSTGFWQ
jgi:hypothetical protein